MLDTTRNKLDDRGVSPVIGVILMVAITVILAAVIGSFVLGIGGDIQETPQASLQMEDTNGESNITVVHNGGDTLTLSDFHYTVDGEAATQFADNATIDGQFTPGQTLQLYDWYDTSGSEQDFTGGNQYTVRIIHDPSGQVVAESTVRVKGP